MSALPAADLERLAADARAGGRLGLDTEFMTEGRYHPLLCLVQVSVDDRAAEGGVRVELLDPLEGHDDPAPLAAVLADPERARDPPRRAPGRRAAAPRLEHRDHRGVGHAGRAGFAGFSAQAGYTNLLPTRSTSAWPSSAGFTRWDLRPLSAEQLDYAAGDVLHLLALADAIEARLRERGAHGLGRGRVRGARALRPCAATSRRCGSGCPRAGGLSGRQRAVARSLTLWREETAAAEDKPVATVLPDAALVEIARRRPADEDGARARSAACTAGSSAAGPRGSSPRSATGAEAEPIPREAQAPSASSPATRR